MAASKGYQCEFLRAVSEDFYCKKCTLVARRLTIISCCGESFCHACIADTQEQDKSCPACEEKEYNILEHVKNQRRINCLQVYCSVKERGCDWSGTLEQLDTHLDPDQDNCQYMDTKCPLDCHMTIPKNEVEQHVAQHCAKRPYVCQYCSFKAIHEEVVDKHLPECKYVPLQCPNLCGVTFERDFMEDHMNMCRLEEVGCEFSGVGCDGQFIREDQEEHTRQNSQKHLTLTAYLAAETKEQLQQKLLELDKEHKEEEEKLKQKIEEQEKKIKEQEEALKKQEQESKEQKKILEHQFYLKLQGLEQKLLDLIQQNELKVSKMSSTIYLSRRFELNNFRHANKEYFNWKSPAMYTHVCGYKFCIGVYARGCNDVVRLSIFSMPGELDDQLKWPARAKFTVELLKCFGENVSHTREFNWVKATTPYCHLGDFNRISSYGFLEYSKIDDFAFGDSLCFCVSEIQLL